MSCIVLALSHGIHHVLQSQVEDSSILLEMESGAQRVKKFAGIQKLVTAELKLKLMSEVDFRPIHA